MGIHIHILLEVLIILDEGASENPSKSNPLYGRSTISIHSISFPIPHSQWPATLEHYSKRPRKPPQVQQAASASSADEERNGKTQQTSTHKQPMPSGYKSRILKQARPSRRPLLYNKPNSTSPTTWPTPSPRPSKSTAKSHRTMPRASSPPPSPTTPPKAISGAPQHTSRISQRYTRWRLATRKRPWKPTIPPRNGTRATTPKPWRTSCT